MRWIDCPLVDQTVADLGAGNEDQVEIGAGLVETDRSVARAVPSVDKLEIDKAIAGFKYAGCLLGNNERIKISEEFEVAAIERQLATGTRPSSKAIMKRL